MANDATAQKSAKGASRAAAAQVLFAVLEQGRSLATVLPEAQTKVAPADKGWVQAVCYEVLRELPRYEWLVKQLLDKPLKKKVRIVHCLLLVGLCQFRGLGTPPHAVLAETVEATKRLKHKALTGLVNGVLRNYQRQQAALETQVTQKISDAECFPRWIQQALNEAWPEARDAIFNACQQRPPLWLRVNVQKVGIADYLVLLQARGIEFEQHAILKAAIKLPKATDVRALPHFAEGYVSVQDISAQWAAHLLQAENQHRVLDACAAPGGKTAHIFELAPEAHIDAIEIEASRIPRMEENFARLGVRATIYCADMLAPHAWWNGELYDRILLDAPCSATGVIRRHPDIKWLRQAADIGVLQHTQADILEHSWKLLKPAGRLVYATCSILPAENETQVNQFLSNHEDAIRIHDPAFSARHSRSGQILPGEDDGDGFYYAILEKRAN